MMKHTFDLSIKSSTSDVSLNFNTAIGKWEAISLPTKKVLARRKNVLMLVLAINESEAA
jgi:hypothetical protein